MAGTPDEINYLRTDFEQIEKELENSSDSENMRIEVNDGLAGALQELQSLKDQLSTNESARLIDLCKNTVIEAITGQFGLAGLFIESRDGGNVTTGHNFKKGVVSTDSDQKKYNDFVANNNGSKEWKEIRKETGYDKPLPKLRREAFKKQEVIVDAYTGKPLPKDGRTHLDHIVSAKEIESSAANHLFLTPEERAKIATNDKNLAFTASSANISKDDLPMSEWLSKEDNETGQNNLTKHGINKDMALEKDSQARNYIKREVSIAAVKKYSSELLKTGGKDAAMMATYSAFGVILRDITQAIFIEIHVTLRDRGKESFSAIFKRFQERLNSKLAEIKSKWKDILKGSLESGITAFFSNLLVFVINLVATTLKKIVMMIRAGFVSLVQAVKIMTKPPEGMSAEEAGYQALKIITAGLIGAASLGLSASIEKLLQSIPGLQPLMMFPVPFPGREPRTISDILAAILSALVGGLLTTIVLYFMDKCRENSKRDRLQIQLVNQSGVVVQYKIAQTWVYLDEAYARLQNLAIDSAYYLNDGQIAIKESGARADQALQGLSNAKNKLKNMFKNN